MIFSSRISMKSLAVVCRSLGTTLDAGVDVIRAFKLAGEKTSDPRLSRTMADIGDRLKRGEDITSSLEAHADYFPNLFIDMVNVAEKTGTLPEVFKALAIHYENNVRLKQEFLSQIAMPVFQLLMAIFVIAGLIALLGWIAESTAGDPVDVLGWGLMGTNGAITWLTMCFGSAFVVFVCYKVLTANLSGAAFLHRLLMRIPVVGYCMQSFAIARFSWAYHLTQDAGMPVDESLEASLRATANGAYIGATPTMIGDVMRGDTVTDAFASSGLFPADYVQMVHVGEETGTVPETLHRLSPQFEDQARRSLKALAAALGWFVWGCVAAFIVFVIFSIITWYVGLLNSFMP